MKRVIILATILFFLLNTSALEDYSPEETPTSNQPTFQSFDPLCSQNAAGISQIMSRTDTLTTTCNQCLKKTDLSTFETTVDEKFDRKIGRILANMLTILAMWTAFFFAIQFLMISKGWISYGTKTTQPKTEQKKPLKKPFAQILSKGPKPPEQTKKEGLEQIDDIIQELEEKEKGKEPPKPNPEDKIDEMAENISKNGKEFGEETNG